MTFRQIDQWIDRVTARDPYTNVYGVARSLLALSTLLTFAFTDVHALFRPAVGIDTVPVCNGWSGRISFFCLMSNHLDAARVIVVAVLAIIASGWRPRITGVLHWWLSFSFMSSAILVDGGDQVTSVLTLLLLPVTFTDSRRWHWSSPSVGQVTLAASSKRLIGIAALTVVRFQVAVIYLHAAVAKCAVVEWMNGTALYYWFTDPMFGSPKWLDPFLTPALTHGVFVTFLTWSVITLEFFLFAGLLCKEEYRHALLLTGVSFHLGIALIHGLISFSITMIGALVLLLRPVNAPFAMFVFRFKRRVSAELPPLHGARLTEAA